MRQVGLRKELALHMDSLTVWLADVVQRTVHPLEPAQRSIYAYCCTVSSRELAGIHPGKQESTVTTTRVRLGAFLGQGKFRCSLQSLQAGCILLRSTTRMTGQQTDFVLGQVNS